MFTLTQFINALSELLKNGNLPVKFFNFLTPCSIMDIEVLENGVLLLFEFDRELDGSINGEELLQRFQTLLEENPEIKHFPVMFNEDVNTLCMVQVTNLNISEQDNCIELF